MKLTLPCPVLFHWWLPRKWLCLLPNWTLTGKLSNNQGLEWGMFICLNIHQYIGHNHFMICCLLLHHGLHILANSYQSQSLICFLSVSCWEHWNLPLPPSHLTSSGGCVYWLWWRLVQKPFLIAVLTVPAALIMDTSSCVSILILLASSVYIWCHI